MAHDHSTAGGASRGRLTLVIAIVSAVLVVELIGGALSGSLALLADAGHMFSDLAGLSIALLATVVAGRPASDRHTYGFRRSEVFGALLNGLILIVVAVSIGIEGGRRLLDSGAEDVATGMMLVVAIIGLVANIASMMILRGGSHDSINMRGAYLEVLADALGSVAVIVAAVIIMVTGFVQADAIASIVIAVAILPRAFVLIRDVWRVLNEGAPRDTDVALIRQHILSAPGVVDVHDVHVWSLTPGQNVFTAHVIADADVFAEGRTGELLTTLNSCLSEHFDVEHSTFQLEPAQHAGQEPHRHD